MNVSVEFSWSPLGTLRLDEAGRLLFPTTTRSPGVYRFTWGDRVYIGESDNLQRRFTHYRNPGPSQATNLRINDILRALLQTEGLADVSTMGAIRIMVDAQLISPDMASRSQRLLLENAALVAARAEGGVEIENL